MSQLAESVLTVPAELTRRSKGFAFDFGCSTLKCVYRTKEDFDEVADEEIKVGHLHHVTAGRDQLIEFLALVRDRTHSLPANEAEVCSTGAGSAVFSKLANETLNVRLKNLPEFDCFTKAFFYLASRLPRDLVLEPFLEESTVEPLAYIQSLVIAMQGVKITQAVDVPSLDVSQLLQGLSMAVGKPLPVEPSVAKEALAIAEPDTFPCLLVACGSGVCFVKVEKDGSFKIVDASNRGGKSLLGIGALLTGCKTFGELVELASKGDTHNVDQYSDELNYDVTPSSDVANQDGEDDMYTKTKEATPFLMFCFGKAASPNAKLDSLKPEDKARSWFNYLLLELVQSAHHLTQMHDVKRLFFCGGLASNQLVREILTTELVRRNLTQMLMNQVNPIRFDFIKSGAHLGALGCMVNHVDKFF